MPENNRELAHKQKNVKLTRRSFLAYLQLFVKFVEVEIDILYPLPRVRLIVCRTVISALPHDHHLGGRIDFFGKDEFFKASGHRIDGIFRTIETGMSPVPIRRRFPRYPQ